MDGQPVTCWQAVHAMILLTFIKAVYVHCHGDGCSLGWGVHCGGYVKLLQCDSMCLELMPPEFQNFIEA